MPLYEVKELIKKLNLALQKSSEESEDLRSQIFLALAHIVKSFAKTKILLEFNEEWMDLLSEETDAKSRRSLLSLLANWFASGRPFLPCFHDKLLQSMKQDLTCCEFQVKVGALKVLGHATHVLSAQDRSLATDIMAMINRHTKDQDPRVRKAAFEALLCIHHNGNRFEKKIPPKCNARHFLLNFTN